MVARHINEKVYRSFKNWNPELIQKMEDTSHNYDEENLNPWHLEGSIWNHTVLVMNKAEEYSKWKTFEDAEILMYAAILHDVGKLYTRKEMHEKKRVSFFNHEAFSIQPAIDFMTYMNKDNEFIETVIKIISLHMKAHKAESKEDLYVLVDGDEELLELMIIFNKCDGEGRISSIEIEQKF